MLAVTTPYKQEQLLQQTFIKRRLDLGYTQESLAQKSGVSYSSVKRFEALAKISLTSFLKLAMVLECLNDFEKIGQDNIVTDEITIEELQKKLTKSTRKRGYK